MVFLIVTGFVAWAGWTGRDLPYRENPFLGINDFHQPYKTFFVNGLVCLIFALGPKKLMRGDYEFSSTDLVVMCFWIGGFAVMSYVEYGGGVIS